MENKSSLSALAEKFINKLESRNLAEESLLSYQASLNRICRFALNNGKSMYYQKLGDEYSSLLNQRYRNGEITRNTWNFNVRVLRMFVSFAETGEIDYARKPMEQKLYILSVQGEKLVHDILEYSDIPERRYGDNLSVVRHILWYTEEKGYELCELDDEILLEFISVEAPKSNKGSMSMVMKVVNCVAKYYQDHNIGNVQYSYQNLKVKQRGRNLLPSYEAEEVKAMIDCLETDDPKDRRNRAMILLSYTTGLRCVDVINLKFNEIDWRKQCIYITQCKTGVPMIVEVPAAALNALADYILDYRPKIDSEYVFITSKSQYKEIKRSLNWMIAAIEKRAGVEHKPYRGFHGLRRSFAVSLASSEVPLETLSRMLGHVSPSSDRQYLSFNRDQVAFVALDFRDVPVNSKTYMNLAIINREE